jgi:hypothetical protein
VTRVTIDSKAVPFTIVSGRRLSVTLPAHIAATVPVLATSPFGESNALTYTFLAAPPTTPPPTSTAPAPPP